MSSLFLGVLDAEITKEYAQSTGFCENRLGGKPQLSVTCREPLPTLKCRSCGSRLGFVLQIYCPVDESPTDRVIYFFACLAVVCEERQVQALRVVTDAKVEKSRGKVKAKKLFDDEWDVIEDDLQEKKQDTTEEPKVIEEVNPDDNCYFRPHYIAVIEEPSATAKQVPLNLDKYADLIAESNSSSGLTSLQVGEEYEKTYSCAFATDTANFKFYKHIRHCPEQLIRYEWSGHPLASTNRLPQPKPTLCGHCGSRRVFEMQLMPALLTTLHRSTLDKAAVLPLEFETIQVYTCERNCHKTKNIYEEEVFIFKENYKLEKEDQNQDNESDQNQKN